MCTRQLYLNWRFKKLVYAQNSSSLRGRYVPILPLSGFRRDQIILEVRYEQALPLWDRAGQVWEAIGRNFKSFKIQSAAPNEAVFFGDNRFTMAVSLERASITDHRPQGTPETTFDVFKSFTDAAISTLGVRALSRLGNRYVYALECKSREDMAERLRQALPGLIPPRPLFSFEPKEFAPSLVLESNDGALAGIFRLHQREQSINFQPPPDALASGVERIERTVFAVVLDFDFSTRKTMAVESFETKSWLQGTYKTMTRDVDGFLNWAEGLK